MTPIVYDANMSAALSQAELEAAHCWEADDRVPGRPEMTEFRRRLRYHQAQWREANGHPIGSQPIAPRPDGGPVRLVGSRLPLAYARETGANFLTAGALDAARARTSFIEPHQSFDHQRLWADLLSSEAISFNLFGDLAADLGLADRAVHTWWPDAPGTVCDVRFAHSPGRLDRAYLENLIAFDVAFVLDLGDGTQGNRRRRHQIPRADQTPPSEAEAAAAVPGDHRTLGHLRAGGDRRGQRDGPPRDVARAPAGSVDAPAPERHVELGPLRRRPPRRQLGLRRGVRQVPRSTRGSVDLLLRDRRGASRRRRPPEEDGRGPTRAVHHQLRPPSSPAMEYGEGESPRGGGERWGKGGEHEGRDGTPPQTRWGQAGGPPGPPLGAGVGLAWSKRLCPSRR